MKFANVFEHGKHFEMEKIEINESKFLKKIDII